MAVTREANAQGLKRPRELHEIATLYRKELGSHLCAGRGTMETPSKLETRR